MTWLDSTNSKRSRKPLFTCAFLLVSFSTPSIYAEEPFLDKQVLFEEKTDGFSLYRIPGIVVTAKGTILCFYESGIDPPKVKRNRDWAYANLTLARFNLDWVDD